MSQRPASSVRASGPAASTLAPAISNWIDSSAARHYVTLIASTAFIGLAHVLGARIDWRVYAVMGSWVVANALMTRWAARPVDYARRLGRYGWTIVIDVLFLGVTYVMLDAAQYLGIAFFAHMMLIATATLPRPRAIAVAALIVGVYMVVVVLPVAGLVHVASPIGLPPVTGNRLFVVAGIAGALWTVLLLMHLQTRFVNSMRDAERRYVTLVESASDMVMTFDQGGHFLDVNPATIEQTGYTWEEIKRLPNTAFFPPADWPAIMGAFARTKAGASVELEVRYVRKDGAERWVHTSAFPLTVDGKAATVVIARDVTDAHRRHDELREKDERLNIVLRALKAGFITFDRDVRVTSVFGDWARAQETKGVRLIGADLHALFGGDAPGGVLERHADACRRVLAGEEASVSWAYPTDEGERSFRSHLVPLRDAEDVIVGGVALWVDETALAVAERERRQLQQRVADAERIESLGKLVSGVAHELNNPLAAILNFTEDLLADTRTPEERLALEVIQAQALRSRTIVRDLLTYARRDVARPQTPAAPGPILHSLARAMQRGFATQGVNFTVELRDADTAVPLDRTGFEQVVTNLLTNAGQAAGTGGSVRLSSRARDGWFEVIVEDNGAGIPPDVAARMFEPFFTTKPTGHGVGLGLSVSAGIVQAHGGSITAQNRPAEAGGGARFVLRLPLPAEA
ncbi:MAG TPA: ATP-binding protein, partial [Gemmatimonadaceae bacterium]|nr:ATP-binding protein [Gemmatimonadaceae bacterium]